MSENNIGAAARLPDPGPCTAKAHHWNRGHFFCNCTVQETRDGDCTGWKVASRLSDAEIAALICGGAP